MHALHIVALLLLAAAQAATTAATATATATAIAAAPPAVRCAVEPGESGCLPLHGGLLRASIAAQATAGERVPLPCPETIETTQSLPQPPPGAVVLRDVDAGRAAISRLDGVGFHDGGPDSDYVLAPETSSRMIEQGDRLLHRWPIGAEGIWVNCSYHRTRIRLAYELPAHLTACLAAYSNDAVPHFIEAWCE